MSKTIKLSELLPGETGKIIEINPQINSVRFVNMGIVFGSEIKCIHKAKGIGAYYLKTSLIAIRDEDCEKILIESRETDAK